METLSALINWGRDTNAAKTAPQLHTPVSLIFALFILSLLVIQAYLKIPKKHDSPLQPAKRYPHYEPILGLDLILSLTTAIRQGRFLENLTSMLTQHGPTVSYSSFGNTAVITIDPANIKHMLSTNFVDFGLGSARKTGLAPLLGNGVFNSDGLQWHNSRQLLRSMIAQSKSRDFTILDNHVNALLCSIKKAGYIVDLQSLFQRFALDAAMHTFFGQKFHSTTEPAIDIDRNDFADAFQLVEEKLSGVDNLDFGRLIKNIFCKDYRLAKSLRTIECFLDEILRKCNSQQCGVLQEEDMLDYLRSRCSSDEEVKEHIKNILLAAKNTQAALMSNLWYILSHRPDIFSRLREDIAKLGNVRPSADQLHELKYLRNVVNEVLRLYPPVPLNQRTASVDTTLPLGGGIDGMSPMKVRKGTSIGYSVYAMHRRSDIWGDDASEFKPERWAKIRPGWAFLPFNGGKRSCLGQQFAIQQALYVTVCMIQSFNNLQPQDNVPWVEHLGLNCTSRHGVNVELKPAAEQF